MMIVRIMMISAAMSVMIRPESLPLGRWGEEEGEERISPPPLPLPFLPNTSPNLDEDDKDNDDGMDDAYDDNNDDNDSDDDDGFSGDERGDPAPVVAVGAVEE